MGSRREVCRPSLQGADEMAQLPEILALAVVGCVEVGVIHEGVGIVHVAIRISDRSRELLTWWARCCEPYGDGVTNCEQPVRL